MRVSEIIPWYSQEREREREREGEKERERELISVQYVQECVHLVASHV